MAASAHGGGGNSHAAPLPLEDVFKFVLPDVFATAQRREPLQGCLDVASALGMDPSLRRK